MTDLRLSFGFDDLDLIEDALAYYRMSDMGGGDRHTPEDNARITRLLERLEAFRAKVDAAYRGVPEL
jgi:hypothetical protein